MFLVRSVLVKPAGGEQLGRRPFTVERVSAVGQLQLVRKPRRRPLQQPGLPVRHRPRQRPVLQHDPDLPQGGPADGRAQEETGLVGGDGVEGKRNEAARQAHELLHVHKQAADATWWTTSQTLEGIQPNVGLRLLCPHTPTAGALSDDARLTSI